MDPFTTGVHVDLGVVLVVVAEVQVGGLDVEVELFVALVLELVAGVGTTSEEVVAGETSSILGEGLETSASGLESAGVHVLVVGQGVEPCLVAEEAVAGKVVGRLDGIGTLGGILWEAVVVIHLEVADGEGGGDGAAGVVGVHELVRLDFVHDWLEAWDVLLEERSVSGTDLLVGPDVNFVFLLFHLLEAGNFFSVGVGEVVVEADLEAVSFPDLVDVVCDPRRGVLVVAVLSDESLDVALEHGWREANESVERNFCRVSVHVVSNVGREATNGLRRVAAEGADWFSASPELEGIDKVLATLVVLAVVDGELLSIVEVNSEGELLATGGTFLAVVLQEE